VGSIGHWAESREMTDRPSQASHSGGQNALGGQKVKVYNTPTIPASSLQNELWSSSCLGVYHWPLNLVVKSVPSIIHAAAPFSSLKELSLSA